MSGGDWGSSDQSIMNAEIHKALNSPKTPPSLFKVLDKAGEAVDFHWSDWETYRTDYEGLKADAARRYYRRYFPDFLDGMTRMFAPRA